jgi:DNA adenine methylase
MSHHDKPTELIEPFAGGGIVSLTAVFEELVDSVIMVELDDDVASVWKTILGADARWLAERITSFELTPENVQAELSKTDVSRREEAFHTLLKNRVNYGGILAPGSSILKYGENGKGIASRWYPETLKKRILGIDKVSGRIQFIHGDGLKVMRDNRDRSDVVFFVDPPYTAAGKKAGRRLYTHNEIDHEELFDITASVEGDFLMTYDNAEGVRELARRHRFDTQVISMNNTHHAEMTELLIGRDLSWARQE